MITIIVVAGLLIGYALVSGQLDRWSISGPLVFTAIGVVLGPSALDILDGSFETGGIEVLAEATLVILLFSDATRIDLAALRKQFDLPTRMLAIGLPLTVAAGTAAFVVLFDEFSLAEAAVLAAVLTPTDAALGQAVVGNPRVPTRIRQGLNVESGLNDGLMLPAITVLTAFVGVGIGAEPASHWVAFAAQQVGFGVLVGLAAGGAGGAALRWCVARGWVDGAMRQIGTLAIAAVAYTGADLTGGNGFVSAFVAGLAFGFAAADDCQDAADFAEDEGQLLTLVTFLFFGAILLGPRLDALTPTIAVAAVLSLTVLRILPVAISLIGEGLAWPTMLYLGWFGPRGLASILFGLGVVEETALGESIFLDVVAWTVAGSIALHGLSAGPAAARYADWYADRSNDDTDGASMAESKPVGDLMR